MTNENWRRNETDAETFLRNGKKRANIESRRPDIRKASQLVGPGIGAAATRVTNWNDLLATFNGYYSSLAGAGNAPNSVENFVGHTVMDSDLGGTQALTGMASGIVYRRLFLRRQADAESITFGAWSSSSAKPSLGWTSLVVTNGWVNFDTVRTVQFRVDDGKVSMRGYARGGSSGTVPCYIPNAYLPQYQTPDELSWIANGGNGPAVISINANTGALNVTGAGVTSYIDFAQVSFWMANY